MTKSAKGTIGKGDTASTGWAFTGAVDSKVGFHLQDITVKGAWSGPADLQLFRHVIADVARLPVLEVVSATHFIADLTLGLGEVVHDYLAGSAR